MSIIWSFKFSDFPNTCMLLVTLGSVPSVAMVWLGGQVGERERMGAGGGGGGGV